MICLSYNKTKNPKLIIVKVIPLNIFTLTLDLDNMKFHENLKARIAFRIKIATCVNCSDKLSYFYYIELPEKKRTKCN